MRAILYYWPKSHLLEQVWRVINPPESPPLRHVIGYSHCAWYIGGCYLSFVPVVEGASLVTWYPLQQGRTLKQDQTDFGKDQAVLLTEGVDAKAMMELGLSILQSGVYWPGQLDNVAMAMLVAMVGLPDHYRRRWQRQWYKDLWSKDPESYDWHRGFSPFKAGKFTDPYEVFLFCREYNVVWDRMPPPP